MRLPRRCFDSWGGSLGDPPELSSEAGSAQRVLPEALQRPDVVPRARQPQSHRVDAYMGHHAVGVAGRHRGRRVAHRRRAAASAAAPLHVREAQVGQAEGGGQPRGIVAVVAVRREAVDLPRVDSRIRARRQDGLQRQREFRLGSAAVLVVRGFADPDDRDPAADVSLPHDDVLVICSAYVAR